MTDDIVEPVAPQPAQPNTTQRMPHISQPPGDEFQLGERAVFEHRGVDYTVHLIDDDNWVIRSADGRTMGSIYIISLAGEEGEPVYGVREPGSLDTYSEGTDWRGIAAAVINEVLDEPSPEND
ncbi:hypothetical protein OSC27_12645 [Microbacterium sp. STN6]|uniref:hypothetical protein n=1 Tax=Microbacterium sp. STN6 TaxID=2995588 RepID=UPI002260D1EC|nr:hypothetical protein [Microbacterium sp. STN6]MCX7523120.1 hypothetical protein [Microbacterium sp. STN6]